MKRKEAQTKIKAHLVSAACVLMSLIVSPASDLVIASHFDLLFIIWEWELLSIPPTFSFPRTECMLVCFGVCSWHFDHGSQALFISVVLKRLLIGPDPSWNIVLSAEHELPWGIRDGTFLQLPSLTIPIHWKEITNTVLSLAVRSVYLIPIYLWSKQGCHIKSSTRLFLILL